MIVKQCPCRLMRWSNTSATISKLILDLQILCCDQSSKKCTSFGKRNVGGKDKLRKNGKGLQMKGRKETKV
jgi:hypothetical protein